MISGIYKIYNKLNGKVYIGSTINLEAWRKHHRQELRKNKNKNTEAAKYESMLRISG